MPALVRSGAFWYVLVRSGMLTATAAPTLAEPWSSGTRVGDAVCNPRERRGVTLRNHRRIRIPEIRQADEPSPGGGQSPPDASPWAEARFAREKGGISLGARWAAPGGTVARDCRPGRVVETPRDFFFLIFN